MSRPIVLISSIQTHFSLLNYLFFVRILRVWRVDNRMKTCLLMGFISVWLSMANTSVFGQAVGVDQCNPANRPSNTVEGGFTVNPKRVCANQPVTVINTRSGAQNIKYIYGYTPDSNIAVAGRLGNVYTFTRPGRYKILQTGSLNGTGMIHCDEVEVLPIDPVRFTVRVCSGRKVVVDIIDAGQYDNYTVNWGDNTTTGAISRANLTGQLTHTYSANSINSPIINIVGNYNAPGGCSIPSAQYPIQSLGSVVTSAPAITRLTSSASAVTLQYQGGIGGTIQLESRSPGGAWASTGQSTSVASGLFTVSADPRQVQCFRLTAQDGCGTTPQTSDEVCSLVLDATAANKQNDLRWQPYTGTGQFRFYRLYRSSAPIGTFNTQAINSYTDKDKIECGIPYCYSLEATVRSTVETVIISAPICVTGQNGEVPGEPRTMLADVLPSGEVRVQAVFPPAGSPGITGQYTALFSRADAPTGTFQPIKSVNNNVLIDETANSSAQSYCYRVVYRNSCGLESAPSQPVCTIWLGSRSNGLDWTGESPFWPGSVGDYTVEVVDGSEPNAPVGTNTHYDPDPNSPNPQRYRIVATNRTSGLVSHSNVFEFRRQARLLVPDAFTPNGDGLNETFVVKGVVDQTFRLTIYGRWGDVIYSTTDKTQGWNGDVNGQPAQAGQYMYRIEVADQTGQKTVRTGALLLVR